MIYKSTRGKAPHLNFTDTVIQGLASDGGLYLPESYPHFSLDELQMMRNQSYTDLAQKIMRPFIDSEITDSELKELVEDSYQNFHHDAICPLSQISQQNFILELFHGPTLAFKDFAMQFLARLMEKILTKRQARATIIGATSGDTGGAAIDAFANSQNADIFILFPKGRVSSFQQKQMTCNHAANVHALAIDGNFDDCQAMVKKLFQDDAFRQDFALSGVNSINWARIMAQIIYYFAAAFKLGAPDRSVSFTVPTGNFGDIFAGFVAQKMGLPIEQLIIATNDNDILVRTLETGIYRPEQLVATTSPSMDIQISSNFERLLFEAANRDAQLIGRQQQQLMMEGRIVLDDNQRAFISKLFSAGRCNLAQTEAVIAKTWQDNGYLMDPHTATALKAAQQYGQDNPDKITPMVILSTAHPVKFPDIVEKATHIKPQPPEWLKSIDHFEEKYTPLANDITVVMHYIAEHSRITK